MPINTAKLAKIQQQSEKARLGGKVRISSSSTPFFIYLILLLGNAEKKEEGCSQDGD